MRKVRFGIIGTNFITDWILEAAREELRFEATAVCSRSRETGQAFALKHSIPHLFTSPEEMAALPPVQSTTAPLTLNVPPFHTFSAGDS